MASTVALGLSGCVDYELTVSAPTLQRLVDQYGIQPAELTCTAAVTSERDLVVSILGHIAQGRGGEHFVGSTAALQTFAQRFPRRTTLGGTAVRAAIALSRLGVPSTLHLVSVNDIIRRLLPPGCEVITSCGEATLHPHLIVEYDHGIRVRAGDLDVQARSANRLIYVNDPANEAMPISDELGPVLRRSGIFLVSGLNGVRDPGILDERLGTLRHHMRQLPRGAIVYYEDAGFHEPTFSQRVRDALGGAVDVHGMNEDELQAYLGHRVDLLAAAQVEDALSALREVIDVPTVVVHTRYWSAAYGERAAEYVGAVNEGIVMASCRYRFGDAYTERQYELMRGRARRAAAQDFAATLQDRLGAAVRCVPGFDLDDAEPIDFRPTTIGLGDTFVGGFLAALARQTAIPWT